MRMSKWFGLFLLLLFVTGCSQFGGSQPGSIPNYRQGYGAVDVHLLPQMPPKEIVEGSPFRIAVNIQNKGAYDTGAGEVHILGLSDVWTPLFFSSVSLPPLRGKSLEAPDGDQFIAEFNSRMTQLPPGASEYKSKFWALVKYDYTTTGQLDVCVNSELQIGVNTKSQGCSVRNSVSLSGQGAPIAVTNVEEVVSRTPSDATIQFTLKVENRGKGDVVSDIVVDEVRLANRRMRCDTSVLTEDDLQQRRNKIVCRVTEPLASPYTTTLSFQLFYTYEVKEVGEFVVKKLGR